MSRYRNHKFNFSHMSERLKFQTQNADGTFTDAITVWAHIIRDGFTRQEENNWFKIMVREQSALDSLLEIGARIVWKKRTLSIHSWHDPSYEDRGFIEILAKQIITSDGIVNGPIDSELFKDIVSIFKMNKTEVSQYGITSFEYHYDFSKPSYENLRCSFSGDRNRYLENKKKDVEYDSLIVKFNIDAPIEVEDYIISPIHGRFKIDMIVKNNDNILEAHVRRSDVQ